MRRTGGNAKKHCSENLAWNALLEVASPGPKGRCRIKRALHFRLRAGKPNSSIGLCLVTCSPAGVTNYHFSVSPVPARPSRRGAFLFFTSHIALRAQSRSLPGSLVLPTQKLQEQVQQARPAHRIFPKWARALARALKYVRPRQDLMSGLGGTQ